MKKMTKAQARKRLKEAADKVGNVWNAADATWKLSARDFGELVRIRADLLKMQNKLK